jgi:AAA+ ATPase superfamily predicted ATPase
MTMARYFNVAGPCVPEKHYMLDAINRLDMVLPLIEQEQYFVIHAARQSGKTTFLLEMKKKLNQSGKYYALYCSLENVQGADDAEKGISGILGCLKRAVNNSTFPNKEQFALHTDTSDCMSAVVNALSDFCSLLDKPLVLFFDEADCLSGMTMLSFLRQLRNGYVTRSESPFVHSLALVGMLSINEYKLQYRSEKETLGTVSPFNISTESLTLKNFTKEEIAELYEQHTADTGQQFEPEALELAWQQTQGQPWLVNAIARESVTKILESDDSQPVTSSIIEQAVQNIIFRRDTHIESLLARLREERLRKILQPIVLGESGKIDYSSDDFLFTRDLGLVRKNGDQLEFANPIYAEVIVRRLNMRIQEDIANDNRYQPPHYINNGRIDMELLLRDFQGFWRENGAIWEEKYEYKEAAPHLILMAFLQRIINGGGTMTREMAVGKGRLDLYVLYEKIGYPIELKIRRNENTYTQGIEQIARYMESLGCQEGWLVVFDRRKNISWQKKLFVRKEPFDNKTITIIGC